MKTSILIIGLILTIFFTGNAIADGDIIIIKETKTVIYDMESDEVISVDKDIVSSSSNLVDICNNFYEKCCYYRTNPGGSTFITKKCVGLSDKCYEIGIYVSCE
jgi:hypothetical protein